MDDLLPLFIIAIVAGGGLLAYVTTPKKPCTCPKCRPDLYEPKTPEEYEQRAMMSRARARYLDSEIERKMKEAEHADVDKLLRDMRSKANA
jgi:hypothetical protein